MNGNIKIDGGKPFDWSKASADYAKYRDIYPTEFFATLLENGMCGAGRRVLDLGTGTGVLPRALYSYGGKFTATDSAEGQIEQAKLLSEGMDINYICSPSEKLEFPDESFDDITACQCFFYFDHDKLAYKLCRMLTDKGKLAVLYLGWLPHEDPIIAESERLIVKYNPAWTGRGETIHKNHIPEVYREYFSTVIDTAYCLEVPFTRESWHGRIKACRGVGASMDEANLTAFEAEHKAFLTTLPESFSLKHFAAITILEKI